MIKRKIYCDMDGVLANFGKEKNAVARFASELGFFTNLEPIRQNVSAIKMLIRMGADVNILSASPNEQADRDKLTWLAEFFPELTRDKIVLCRNGENKADYVEDIEDSLLFDDYGKNCREWRQAGGQAIKIKSLFNFNIIQSIIKNYVKLG